MAEQQDLVANLYREMQQPLDQHGGMTQGAITTPGPIMQGQNWGQQGPRAMVPSNPEEQMKALERAEALERAGQVNYRGEEDARVAPTPEMDDEDEDEDEEEDGVEEPKRKGGVEKVGIVDTFIFYAVLSVSLAIATVIITSPSSDAIILPLLGGNTTYLLICKAIIVASIGVITTLIFGL